MLSSPNLLEKGDNDDSPNVDSGKDNNSTVVDGSGDNDSSWRKMSDMSSSPNLLNKDNEDDEVDALVHNNSSDEDKQEVPLKAQIVQKAKSVCATHKEVVEDEIKEEEVYEKKTRSRFQWSHMADCNVENGNRKDKTLIRILLVKEPWNAGHGQVMKAWQDLTGLVSETVVHGDKIFQGVSKVTLKKRYQLYLDLGKKWEQEKDKRNQPETEEEKHDVGQSTATVIHRGIEDLWE